MQPFYLIKIQFHSHQTQMGVSYLQHLMHDSYSSGPTTLLLTALIRRPADAAVLQIAGLSRLSVHEVFRN